MNLETAKIILDFFHRSMMHHALWYSEVQHQFGREKALEILHEVCNKSYDTQLKRLSKILNFEVNDNVPDFLLQMSENELEFLKEGVAVNWLSNDGIWFQAVEKAYGMFDAKRCNDSCWGQFSPLEAWSVKRLLNLPENSGLDGLKKALGYRLYAAINKQKISEETADSFIFSMLDCRVQSARKRKGLEDYPCKSAGIVEYRTFAETIDKRIKTDCIACPPDNHPNAYFCAWRFYM
ncbi:MAG: DUF6125 family protein [Bacteroidales bacterium]|nr:DUF6125 family protein [Bacteroidales bacterium]